MNKYLSEEEFSYLTNRGISERVCLDIAEKINNLVIGFLETPYVTLQISTKHFSYSVYISPEKRSLLDHPIDVVHEAIGTNVDMKVLSKYGATSPIYDFKSIYDIYRILVFIYQTIIKGSSTQQSSTNFKTIKRRKITSLNFKY